MQGGTAGAGGRPRGQRGANATRAARVLLVLYSVTVAFSVCDLCFCMAVPVNLFWLFILYFTAFHIVL